MKELIQKFEEIHESSSTDKWSRYVAALKSALISEYDTGYLMAKMEEFAASHNSDGQDFYDELIYTAREMAKD